MTSDSAPTGGPLEPYQAPAAPAVSGISRDLVKPRLPEVGRIRLGVRKVSSGGKLYPSRIETFRFTSRSRQTIESVAAVYGGDVEPWDSDEGKQWQVITPATELEVIIPRADLAFSQWYELWAGGGLCERRCNGHWQALVDAPCVCDHEAIKAGEEGMCKLTTRLSVFLPDVPPLALWRVESHGGSAGAEIPGTLELAAAFGLDLLPGRLSTETRGPRRIRNRKTGKPETVKYVVPVLTINTSIREAVKYQQLVQRQRLGLGPSSNDPATDRTMRGLRAAVFSRWPESAKEGPERDRRLAQLSTMLGRPVATISNEHDLLEGEALRLAHLVDSLPDETPQISAGIAPAGETKHRADRPQGSPVPPAEHHTQPAPPPGQAAPALSGTPPTGADSTQWEAGIGAASLEVSAGTAEPREATSAPRGIAVPDPAEHQSEPRSGGVAKPDMPAVHGSRSGASAPTRQRSPKPNLVEEARRATAERREAIPTAPANWCWTFDTAERMELLRLFGASVVKVHLFVQRFVDEDPDIPPLSEWATLEWDPTKLQVLIETARAEKGIV